MLSFIKKQFLHSKQGSLRKRHPGVDITLHAEMPGPSIAKVYQVAEVVDQVNRLEAEYRALSDAGLKAKTAEFKVVIAARAKEYEAEIKGLEEAMLSVATPEEKERLREKLRDTRNKIFVPVIPGAFAAAREAARRTIGLRHFDVQIAGGYVLHEGRIAEMATGEGKTLVATLPAYLNALLGRGVHVVTVNDYLARRDREWMGPVYEFLGLTVGVIQHDMPDEERQHAYAADITYGTNNEFGFDYLRDNMKYTTQELVQRPFYYAIVDEVDSILIDEARTPLIISGPAEESTEKYYTARIVSEQLKGRRVTESDEIEAKHRGENLAIGYDYLADEKNNTVALTDEGEVKAAKLWGIESLHTIETMEYRHHTIQALRAKEFFKRDVHYVVKEGQVVIVDEFTGRLMPGRRWSDGLHQAVESKEGMRIERENQTLATITFQNYFRMYEKLAGMTGTAFTEANEFKSIYKLDVVVMPTNRTLVRANYPDRVYKTEREKFNLVIEEIAELYKSGRPVLVGTISIEKSEHLSAVLKRRGIAHQVLNAKYHEQEAQIVAQAGRFRAVTIATNMAGRGTDILLGGNPEYMARSLAREKLAADNPDYEKEYAQILERYRKQTREEHDKVTALGGLHVIGTERHEARRIDNQLRGRCGRQGDPGSSRFYVSLEDDLMRLFGSERLIGVMNTLGLEEGQVIEHPWVTKSIEIAQRRVEQHNFEIRKQILEYDNVMNKQREVIYAQRREILEGVSLKDYILEILEKTLNSIVAVYAPSSAGEMDSVGLENTLRSRFGLEFNCRSAGGSPGRGLEDEIYQSAVSAYEAKELQIGSDIMRQLELMVFLQIIDNKWKDHLYAMDSLREGIGLRAYGQRDPLLEYKRESFEMFSAMMAGIEEEAVDLIFKLQPARTAARLRGAFSAVSQQLLHPEAEQFSAPEPASEDNPSPAPPSERPHATQPAHAKIGRNDPCPCGSGKKYKKCCGR